MSAISNFAYKAITCCAVFAAMLFQGCNFLSSGAKPNYFVEAQPDLSDLIRSLSNSPADTILNQALDSAELGMLAGNADFVKLFGAAINKKNPRKLMAYLFTKPAQPQITINTTDEAVLNMINTEKKAALRRAFEVMKLRSGKMGSGRPELELDDKKGTIKIGLFNEPNQRTINYLLAKGRLQFFETYTIGQLAGQMFDANKALAAALGVNTEAPANAKKPEPAAGADTASLNDLVKESLDEQAMKKKPLFRLLRINDPESRTPVIGYFLDKDRNKLFQYLENKEVKNALPSDVHFIAGTKPPKDKSLLIPLYAIKMPENGKAMIEGDKIKTARADFSPITAQPDINMDMTPEGAQLWKILTGRNVGNFIAIVFDDVVFSCPRVDNEISSGATEISGAFTAEEALDMANLLKSGSFNTPLQIVKTYAADGK